MHVSLLQPKPGLVSISHVPTSSGRVYDAEAVGAAAAAAGVPYLLDACQSAGQMPLDVQKLQCDFLTGQGDNTVEQPVLQYHEHHGRHDVTQGRSLGQPGQR
jgi:Cys-tRNA synthase (O-phospho-L-seryl-tRNA:Cys-tRNA synthase)